MLLLAQMHLPVDDALPAPPALPPPHDADALTALLAVPAEPEPLLALCLQAHLLAEPPPRLMAPLLEPPPRLMAPLLEPPPRLMAPLLEPPPAHQRAPPER